jgi:hypothetical protein
MRFVASILRPAAIRRILKSLHLPAAPIVKVEPREHAHTVKTPNV